MYLKEIISKYRTELMGVAIWHVMLIHAYFWTGINLIDYQFSVFHSFIKLCYVQTFLFLSGFGCMSSFNKYPDIRKFYLKRIKRALIPFWIISLPFFLYEDIFKYFDVKTFFCDLTTLKFWISGNHLGMWYVSILLFCYMLTPFAYKICKFSLKWGGYGGLLVTIILLKILGLHSDYYTQIAYGAENIPYFFAGCIAASINKSEKSNWVLWLCLGILLCTLSLLPTLGLLIYTIAFNCLKTNRLKNIFHWLGTYSFEIYLLHMLSLHTLPQFGHAILFVLIVYSSTFLLCKPMRLFTQYISDKIIKI